MTFGIHAEAREEIAAAAAWYEQKRGGLGAAFMASVELAFEQLRSNPEGGSLLEYYPGPYPIRRITLTKFSYVVIAETYHDRAYVVAVSHSQQQPLYWLHRLQ